MTSFIFPFEFLGSNYNASCHVIFPPQDKQYHITVYDEPLRERYGDVQIVILKGDELTWGIPQQPKGSEFMKALVAGLKEQLAQHPEY